MRHHLLGVRCWGVEADWSPPSNAEVQNAWSCTSCVPHLFLWHGVQLSIEVTLHPQALPMQMWMLFSFVVPEQENILWAGDTATERDSCSTKTTQCSTYETMWMCSVLSIMVNYLKIQVTLPSFCEWGQEEVIQAMNLYNTLYNSTWLLFLDSYIMKMKTLSSFKI